MSIYTDVTPNDPPADGEVAGTRYYDASIGAWRKGGNRRANDLEVIGQAQFTNNIPFLPASDPTDDNHVARKKFIDDIQSGLSTDIQQAETEAKNYADTQDSAVENRAETYTDERLDGGADASLEYGTDGAIQGLRDFATDKKTEAITDANTYTDGEISTLDTSLRSYTDSEIDAIIGDISESTVADEVIYRRQQAFNYTDSEVDTVQSNLDTHIAVEDGAHGATPDALADRLMQRDDNGRAQVEDPSLDADIATKFYVDDAIASSNQDIDDHIDATTSVHGSTSAPTDNTIMERDSDGGVKITTPDESSIASDDSVNFGFLETYALTQDDLDTSSDTANTADTLVLRDADGRSQISDPVDFEDIASRGWVETHVLDHTDLTGADGVHGATAANTPDTLITRDADGQAKITDPTEAQDIATKNYIDTELADYATSSELTTHIDDTGAVHGAVTTADADQIVLRDANSQAEFGNPTANAHAATKLYVDDEIAAVDQAIYGTTSITTDTTVDANTNVVLADASANAITITLDATNTEPGVVVYVKAIDTTNDVTITTAAGNLDGGTTDETITTQWGVRRFVTDGTDWFIV